jgi:hypothetical protein
MNKTQYLLTKLAEEASEISQAALKAQQFGFDSINPYNQYTNLESLHGELNDLWAIIEMLNENHNFMYAPSSDAIKLKKEKVEKFYHYVIQ